MRKSTRLNVLESAFSGTRNSKENTEIEIIAISATQSKDFRTYKAENAVDRDMSTKSIAMPEEDGVAWLRLNLDKTYCVKKVVRLRSYKVTNNHTHFCSGQSCGTCTGWTCQDFELSVYSDRSRVDHVTGNEGEEEVDCKTGDTVEFRTYNGYYIAAYEVAIFTV